MKRENKTGLTSICIVAGIAIGIFGILALLGSRHEIPDQSNLQVISGQVEHVNITKIYRGNWYYDIFLREKGRILRLTQLDMTASVPRILYIKKGDNIDAFVMNKIVDGDTLWYWGLRRGNETILSFKETSQFIQGIIDHKKRMGYGASIISLVFFAMGGYFRFYLRASDLPDIFNSLFKNYIYIRIRPNLISLKRIDTKEIYEDIPLVAFNKKGLIVAIGKISEEAQLSEGKTNISLENGFSHSRVIMNDPFVAEMAINYFLRKLSKNKWTFIRPLIVFHPLIQLEGGLTGTEAMALYHIGMLAGGREIYVWSGRELLEEEILKLEFPIVGMLFGRDFWNKVRIIKK